MKVIVEISGALLRQTRKLAAREGVTLRSLIERGLMQAIGETNKSIPFKLRRAAFKGNGLQAEFRDSPGDAISDAGYDMPPKEAR